MAKRPRESHIAPPVARGQSEAIDRSAKAGSEQASPAASLPGGSARRRSRRHLHEDAHHVDREHRRAVHGAARPAPRSTVASPFAQQHRDRRSGGGGGPAAASDTPSMTRPAMIGQGWAPEGYRPNAFVICAPKPRLACRQALLARHPQTRDRLRRPLGRQFVAGDFKSWRSTAASAAAHADDHFLRRSRFNPAPANDRFGPTPAAPECRRRRKPRCIARAQWQ